MTTTSPRRPGPGHPAAGLTPFVFDLTDHEIRRVGAVLDAMPDWNPSRVIAAETEVYVLLYSGLNVEQRAIYDLLRDRDVLDAGS